MIRSRTNLPLHLAPTLFIAAVTLLVSAHRSHGVDDPEGEFLRAYMQSQRAEKLESEGRLGEALSRYRAAAEILQAITRENPDWQTMIVEYRTRRTLKSIERLQEKVKEVEPMTEPELPVREPSTSSGMDSALSRFQPRSQEKSIADLERRLAELQKRLENSEKNQGVIRTELNAARQESASLKKRLAESEKQVSELNKQIEESRQAESGLRKELEEARKMAEPNSQKISELEKQLAEVSTERDRIREAIAKLPGAESDPVAKLASIQAQFEESLAKNKEFQSKMDEILKGGGSGDASALRAEISRLSEEVIRLQEQAEDYKATIRALEEQVETTSAQLTQLRIAGGNSAETERLKTENALLKEILRAQLKAQARRDQARKLIAEELAKMKSDSDLITRELDLLAQPIIEIDDERRKELSSLLREPVLGPGETPPDLTAIIAADGPPDPTKAPAGPGGGPDSDVEALIDVSVPEGQRELAREARRKFEQKDYKGAEKLYDTLLAKAPSNTFALTNLGVVYFHTGRLKSAELILKKSLQIDPEDAFAHQTLGIVHYRQGRYDEAMAALTRALDINPKNAVAHNYLGITASKKGWPEAAEKELLESIAINPNYAEAHFNLAIIYAMNKPPSIELTRRHYQKALELGAAPDKALEKFISGK